MSSQQVTRGRARRGSLPAVLRPTGGALRLGNLEWTTPSSPERMMRRRRRFRRARRLIGLSMAFGVIGGMAFAGLLLITPSVAQAPELVSALDREHGAPYPAAVVPARFSVAFTALQDRTGGSRTDPVNGVGSIVGKLIEPSRRDELSLDQRLASILYLHGRRGTAAWIERAVLGLKLYWSYSRPELLGMYAAVANFGHGYYGLAAASCGYFGRRPPDLSWAQIATLAAVAADPIANDPYTHFAQAKSAQSEVLRELAVSGVLSHALAGQASRQRLHLASPVHEPPGRAGVTGAAPCALR